MMLSGARFAPLTLYAPTRPVSVSLNWRVTPVRSAA